MTFVFRHLTMQLFGYYLLVGNFFTYCLFIFLLPRKNLYLSGQHEECKIVILPSAFVFSYFLPHPFGDMNEHDYI